MLAYTLCDDDLYSLQYLQNPQVKLLDIALLRKIINDSEAGCDFYFHTYDYLCRILCHNAEAIKSSFSRLLHYDLVFEDIVRDEHTGNRTFYYHPNKEKIVSLVNYAQGRCREDDVLRSVEFFESLRETVGAQTDDTKTCSDDAQPTSRSNYLVVKSNDLIQKARFGLSTQQQKILLFIISQIKPDDTVLQAYTFDMVHFCKMCGIEQLGQNYQNLKSNIEALRKQTFSIENSKMNGWIKYATIDKRNRTITITLNDALEPYLLHLHNNFTSYELEYAIILQSKYSIRLYELLLSYCDTTIPINIEDLKMLLQTTKYKEYKEFRRRVIDVAVNEINKYTNLQVEYSCVRQNRNIVALLFTIAKKDTTHNVEEMQMCDKSDDVNDWLHDTWSE